MKSNKNCSNGTGDTKRTRSWWANRMTLKCDLDLPVSWVLHIVPLRGAFVLSLMTIVQRVEEI